MNAPSAAIEPHRWYELRQALRLLVWSGGLALTQCLAVFSLPLAIMGARALVRWAPDRAVRRSAQLLLVTGIVQVVLIVVGIVVSVLRDRHDPPIWEVAPWATATIATSFVEIVAWIRSFRGLCIWAQATHIVDAWDRTIRHLPPTFLVAILSGVGVAVTGEGVFALITLAACLWALWLIGHPTWWTYRLFTADVRPAHPVAVVGPPPPPPPPPSYWD